MGLVNRVSQPAAALAEAVELAEQLAAFPQTCLRQDRLSLYAQQHLSMADALANEWEHGVISLASDARAGATRFAEGKGRHGA
jgi:enoyl-CoA hydratase